MFDTKDKLGDDGVSPVIGVILMVAITVILAAVIGTFVLDLAGNLNQSSQASVTFDEDTNNDEVAIQAVSIQSADFAEVRVSASDTAELAWVGGASNDVGGANSDDLNYDLESVGNNVTLNYNDDGTDSDAASGTITAVGYLEGEGSVLQTYEYGG